MKCPNCHSPVDVQAQFCSRCGHDLQVSPDPGGRRTAVYFGIFLLIAVVLSSLALWRTKIYHRPSGDSPDAVSQQNPRTPGPATGSGRDQNTGMARVQQGRINLPVGTVIIEDITGGLISESPAPVIDNGWMALPLRLGQGGFRWRVRVPDVGETTIEGGIFRDFDTVGLWQTALPAPVKGPDLHPWNEDNAIDWISLETGTRLGNVTPRECVEEGYFISCALPSGLSGPGVFFQENRAVGWTFGAGAEGAFFWNGREGQRLGIEVQIDDYYRLSFADSREEKFLQALADNRQGDLQRLEELISAFQFPKKLSIDNTPDRLRDKTVNSDIMDTIRRVASQGDASAVLDLFNRGVLLDIDDIDILLLVSRETGELYGAAGAVETLEDIRDYISTGDPEASNRLNAFHRSITVQHLEELSEQGDWASVARRLEIARSYFPDDPEIHLFEVRLALFDRDWTEAERLLYSKSYPVSLQTQVTDIEREIQELKGLEGKIVIRFTPGARNIPVLATLNGQVSLDFLIDTGASTVTIPSSTARRLGIPIESAGPKRQVYTAGGLVTAREVILDAIELGGWTVRRVNALVLDIPNQPGLGLLGLNYLNRFNVDMRSEDGILTLTPR